MRPQVAPEHREAPSTNKEPRHLLIGNKRLKLAAAFMAMTIPFGAPVSAQANINFDGTIEGTDTKWWYFKRALGYHERYSDKERDSINDKHSELTKKLINDWMAFIAKFNAGKEDREEAIQILEKHEGTLTEHGKVAKSMLRSLNARYFTLNDLDLDKLKVRLKALIDIYAQLDEANHQGLWSGHEKDLDRLKSLLANIDKHKASATYMTFKVKGIKMMETAVDNGAYVPDNSLKLNYGLETATGNRKFAQMISIREFVWLAEDGNDLGGVVQEYHLPYLYKDRQGELKPFAFKSYGTSEADTPVFSAFVKVHVSREGSGVYRIDSETSRGKKETIVIDISGKRPRIVEIDGSPVTIRLYPKKGFILEGALKQ